MRVVQITGSVPSKRVRVEGFAPDRPVSDDLVAGFAMRAANETPSSLFGWHVTRDEEGATVVLHTD